VTGILKHIMDFQSELRDHHILLV